MAIHGREAELEAVSAAIAAALDGESRPVVVVGEAGIGKSALLDAAALRADEAGLVLLRGSAVEHERDVPFALAAAVLEDHVQADELVSEHLSSADRFRHHRALRAAVDDIAGARPFAL